MATRHDNAEPANLLSDEELSGTEMLCVAMLHGPAELGELLQRTESCSEATAREFYVGKCLAEVQKAGFAVIRWIEFAKELRQHSDTTNPAFMLNSDALLIAAEARPNSRPEADRKGSGLGAGVSKHEKVPLS
jgi:hypothetical protein